MHKITNTLNKNTSDNLDKTLILLGFNPDNTIIFDIETTTLSPRSGICYLIGIIHHSNHNNSGWEYIQWFAENAADEESVLHDFNNFIGTYDTTLNVINFNGNTFDIPYVSSRFKTHNITSAFDNIISIDIYNHARKIQPLLQLENLRQKTIEEFLNYQRLDLLSGRELTKMYREFNISRDPEIKRLILQHNLDDIQGLSMVASILLYEKALNSNFNNITFDLNNNELIVKCTLEYSVPAHIHKNVNGYTLILDNDMLSLAIPVYNGELKYFYKDYKDYYYLINEDKAIHKSVAAYVDPHYRTKATRQNCYNKKAGTFIPQPEEMIAPAFKTAYDDKMSYYEFEQINKLTPDKANKYIKSLINYMLFILR